MRPPAQESLHNVDIEALDAELKTLQEEVGGLKDQEKTLKTKVASLESAAKIDELETDLQKQKETNKELERKLAGGGKSKEGDTASAHTAEEVVEINRKWKESKAQVAGAKRLFEDVWAMIVDHLPDGKTAADLQVRQSIPSADCYR